MAKSPQPGHQRTSWSDTKSLRVSTGPWAGRPANSLSSMLVPPPADEGVDAGFDLGDLEGLALDLVEADGVDGELRPDDLEQLAHVHLRDEDLLELVDDVAQVRRQGVQVPQMHGGDRLALLLGALHRRRDGAVGRAPADDQDLALGRA